ncbi:MAG: DUF5681 domain-containing protein [Syntrophobacteraceae bacterium]
MEQRSERKRTAGGHRFEKGKSGNPLGRPKGSRNKATLIAQALLENEAEGLVRKLVEMALNGDKACLRICIERLVPPRKGWPLPSGLPSVTGSSDLSKFFAAVSARFEAGEMTTSEVRALRDLTESYRRLIEMAELEPRITELEEIINQGRQ